MIRTFHSQATIFVFGPSLAVIYAVAATVVARLGQLDRPGLIAGALTLDLTLLVPLLYYLLVARPRRWPWFTVLPVFVVSVLVAERLIPQTEHRLLDLVSFGAVLAELALIAVIAHKVLQLRKGYRERAAAGMDVYDGLRESACSVLGPVAGAALAYEIAVIYYAVSGWTRSAQLDERSFTVHRNVAYIPLIITAMIALVVETAAVHLLVRMWSTTAAWILTGLSAYTMLWLLGDLHAVRLRPLRIHGETLHIRIGLRRTLSVPLDTVARIGEPAKDERAERRDYLKAVLLGSPNRRIELTEPVLAIGLYGLSRQAGTIDLHVDEPERFTAALVRGGGE